MFTLSRSKRVVWLRLPFLSGFLLKVMIVLFGSLAPQQYSDLRISPGKFNFGSKCIEKECHLLS